MQHTASHTIECDAPARDVYALVTDTALWPLLLGPCEATRVLEVDADQRLVEITATLNGKLMSWQSRRTLRPEAYAVDAEIVQPMPLVAAMNTSWRVIELAERRSLLLLEHFYGLCDDVSDTVAGVTTRAEAAAFIERAIHANSTAELTAYKQAAEQHAVGGQPVQHARHVAECVGDVADVYDVVRDPLRWPELFPACTGARILSDSVEGQIVRVEAEQRGQRVSWDTRRQYFHGIRRIDYELVIPMPFVSSMRGQWRVLDLGARRSLLVVDRWWRMLDEVSGIRDDISTVPEATDFVRGYIDRNATDELVAFQNYLANLENLRMSAAS